MSHTIRSLSFLAVTLAAAQAMAHGPASIGFTIKQGGVPLAPSDIQQPQKWAGYPCLMLLVQTVFDASGANAIGRMESCIVAFPGADHAAEVYHFLTLEHAAGLRESSSVTFHALAAFANTDAPPPDPSAPTGDGFYFTFAMSSHLVAAPADVHLPPPSGSFRGSQISSAASGLVSMNPSTGRQASVNIVGVVTRTPRDER